MAEELWRLLGFPQQTDDAVAFTEADVQALRHSLDLMRLGILDPERQAALVRTWGRSYARLAEWQTSLLADVALERGTDPVASLAQLTSQVLPRVEELQSYAWRRHLASASSRLLAVASPGSPVIRQAVGFVDIVGYTSRSKTMTEAELVEWVEHFESESSGIVVDHAGRVIKNIGDEVLYVADDAAAAVDAALVMTERGADDGDAFPAVRAGVAYGDVVTRLGDVFGPCVNIAARLTSVARPGTVLVDRGVHEALTGDRDEPTEERGGAATDPAAYSVRRVRRISVKGYSRLQAWAVRRSDASASRPDHR